MKHDSISPDSAPVRALAAFLLSYPREHLETLTAALIGVQDLLDGNAELEAEPDEPNGDEQDGAYLEWDSKGPHRRKQLTRNLATMKTLRKSTRRKKTTRPDSATRTA